MIKYIKDVTYRMFQGDADVVYDSSNDCFKITLIENATLSSQSLYTLLESRLTLYKMFVENNRITMLVGKM